MTVNKLLKTDRVAGLALGLNHKGRRPNKTFDMPFFLRKLANGNEAAVNAKIRYMGSTTGPFSTGQIVKVEAFNRVTLEVDGEPEKSTLLANLRARAESMFANCRLSGKPVDVFAIRDALFAEDILIASAPNVRDLVDSWLAYDLKRYETGEIVLRTLWKNKRWTNDFWAFSKQKYGSHSRISDIKAADIKTFILWLRQNRNLSNNVAQSTASHAKVLLNYALDNEWIDRNPFVNFRRQMDDVERTTLTENEVRQFVTFPLESPALAMVRDVFFFACLTGLSYADVEQLRAEHIKFNQHGEKYLHIFRRKMISRKSKVPAIVPLTEPAIVILDHYASNDNGGPLLPLQANAPFNRSLKQIAFMAGINKSVSSKVARNSLATYLVNNGVPMESISAMLGHSAMATTQKYYAKVAPKKVINDFNDLKKRLGGNGLFGIES